jgi:hypothetical protein
MGTQGGYAGANSSANSVLLPVAIRPVSADPLPTGLREIRDTKCTDCPLLAVLGVFREDTLTSILGTLNIAAQRSRAPWSARPSRITAC